MSERLSRVDFVIQKYRLAETTFIEAEEKGAKLGNGAIMDQATVQRFIEDDPSGNLKYLDWMIFQAGGGQDAMEKSIGLWEGESDADPNSLRNQCRMDFVEEQVNGYTDEKGVRHHPLNRDEAGAAWKHWEDRSKFEFIMGDQDVAEEEGYGFFRSWPGKNNLYQKIVNTVKLWHSAQAKLLAQNQKHDRLERLRKSPLSLWSADDKLFMKRCEDSQLSPTVVLDIYSGWKPKEYSQTTAVYKNLDDLLRTLAEVRKTQVMRDVRVDKIYEDANVLVVCPLTVGASIKYGLGKWCVCNKTEFDRSFEARGAADGNWQRYNRLGPIVFLSWKEPMPPWLHKIALHITHNWLPRITDPTSYGWIDCQNQQKATSYADVVTRITAEHFRVYDTVVRDDTLTGHTASDERYFKWGGRTPGQAWKTSQRGDEVMASLDRALRFVQRWGRTFDTNRIVLDFVLDVASLVDKSE